MNKFSKHLQEGFVRIFFIDAAILATILVGVAIYKSYDAFGYSPYMFVSIFLSIIILSNLLARIVRIYGNIGYAFRIV
jgi:hypothetical protein